MEQNKFAAILPVVVGGLVNKIIGEINIEEDEAFKLLYNSELYSALENEKTKVWTYSTYKLFDLFQKEITEGKLELPGY